MTRIVVTGGSGKAGRAVVRDLLEQGHDVLNVDRVPSAESSGPDSPAPFLPADLTDFGQTLEALSRGKRLSGVDAVVHLAAIPPPVHATPDVVFRTNITSTHTVFAAAVRLGLDRVVWVSSETTLGLPFDRPPDYAPIDERHELRPESSYDLSKVLGEEMARQFSRWSGIPFVGLRFSNIMERADSERFPSFWDDPHLRKRNLWSYVDGSHVAQSVRLALEADVRGAEALIIAAADIVMRTPSRQLMAQVFPGVPVKADLAELGTLLGIDKGAPTPGVRARLHLAGAGPMTSVAGAAGNRAGWPVGAAPTDVGARELGGVDSISGPSDQGETGMVLEAVGSYRPRLAEARGCGGSSTPMVSPAAAEAEPGWVSHGQLRQALTPGPSPHA